MEQKTVIPEKNKPKDLCGMRFGKLTVLRKTEQRQGRNVLWECFCDCGNTCLKPTSQLNAGTAKSCGCVWRQSSVHAGDRFGKLTAVAPTEQRSAKSVVWECLCDCGEKVFARATLLVSGQVTSCGCAKREIDEQRDFKNLLTYADGTCIEFAENIGKARKSNSPETGVRGVTRLKNGKYRAKIYFRKQRYELGCFDKLEDAVEARRQAEGRVQEYVDQYLLSKRGET